MTRRRCIVWMLCCLPISLSAYEIGTHAYVTKAAVDGSVLSSTHPKSIVPVLSFNRLDPDKPFEAMFGTTDLPEPSYFDNQPLPAITLGSAAASEAATRDPQNMEGEIFAALIGKGLLPGAPNRAAFEQRIDAWVMRGAIREDDNDFGAYSLGDRDDDPWNNVLRAGCHFYDPINRRALFNPPACFIANGCIPSIDWAMGRTDVLATSGGVLDATRQNHFSWQDARDNYWWALTYNLSLAEESANALSHGFAQNLESGFRKFRFATTLKSVGQVIHLLQDAAQPQHSRNDTHGPPIASALTGDGPADGAFEAYTEARLLRLLDTTSRSSPLTHFDGTPPNDQDLPALRLRGAVPYPVPSFSTPVEFFTTRETDGVPARRGLADLSNRGFFTASTLPVNVATGKPDLLAVNYRPFPPLPEDNSAFFQEIQINTAFYYQTNTIVKEKELIALVPDVLAPNWNQQSGLFTRYGSDGRMPVLAASQTSLADDLIIGIPLPGTESTKYTMSYEVFTAQADALLPRAVAYSTGLIDYFFRGRLEITPNDQKVFAVLNQGEPHTVDAEGYPRRPDNSIFGFDKIRLKVRNVTDAIVESGSVTPAIAQTSGSGTMVAVARYHRNACYQPNMSGERVRAYAPPPTLGAISEPTCTVAAPSRTNYPEISVSALVTISSAADLPGGEGVAGTALPIDQVFDFSADPIPVNATDLFIQVIYRGQLGDEPDGIAVGTHDVREPTYVGIFNNTDYYWNGLAAVPRWIAQQSTFFPQQNADFLRVCVGAGGNSRWAYYAQPTAGFPSLGVPPQPGVVRLAMIFPLPTTPAQLFFVRVTPVMDVTSAPQLSYSTRGQQRQANKERIADAVLNDPQICAPTPPTTAAYWCNDPINRRRGQPFGEVVAPIYYTNGGVSVGDVDAQPLPVFPGVQMKTDGLIKFNDALLANCPPAPI